MKGIDLLLAAGDTVESVHQAAWLALLKRSDFLAYLDQPSPPNAEVQWEPDGGIFDLAVKGEGRTVWIELKVDSGLSEWQLKRQFAHAKAGDSVIYGLLGLERVRARPWATDIIANHKGHVVDADRVCRALDAVQSSASTALEDAKDLARAYRAQLQELRQRGSDFRTATKPWLAHDQFFYEELRNACTPMRGARICYVSNPSGGFEACHWGWTGAGEDVDCYLQWEGRKLCFKIMVTNPATRATHRTKAVEFLRDRPLRSTHIRKPGHLGSGQTMTVGVVDDLPISVETRWDELVQTMTDATAIVKDLALYLK